MSRVKIGMMQIPVLFGRVSENMREMEKALLELKEKPDICVFPECMDIGWANERARELAQEIPGSVSEYYCAMAEKYGVWIAAGLTEKCGDKVYNAALLISDAGEIVLHHRKINLLTGVEDVYDVGDRLMVADTPFGKIGMNICADNSANSVVLAEALGRMGVELLLSPCSWAVRPDRDPKAEPYGEEWHIPYGGISAKYQMAIVGVSNVGLVENGTWKGWKAIGNSIAYRSDGEAAAVLSYGEDAKCCRMVELELQKNPRSGTALADFVTD